MCVSCFVLGSYTAAWRTDASIGNSFADGMTRSPSAVVGRRRRTDSRRHPDAPLAVDHRIVHVGPAGPDRLRCPSTATAASALRRPDRRVRIARPHVHAARRVANRIEHGNVIRAQLGSAVDRTVGVDRRIAPVGRDLVVHVDLRVGPVPLRDDDVPLRALRARRRGRQLAGRDAIRPVGEHGERPRRAKHGELPRHVAAGLARLDAAHPRVSSRTGRRRAPSGISRVALLPS